MLNFYVLNLCYTKHLAQTPNIGTSIQIFSSTMQRTDAFLNSTSPLDASFEIHHVSVDPSLPDFEAQTGQTHHQWFWGTNHQTVDA